MRKLSSIFFYQLLTVLLCITASAQAKERTAPEITSQTLQAGQSYYVYNVGSGLFLSYDSQYAIASVVPHRVQFVSYYGGYSLNFIDIDRRIQLNDDLELTTWSTTDYDTHAYVEAVEGGYRLRPRNNNSNNLYLGISDGTLTRLMASGDIVWALLSIEDGLRYRLYYALMESDSYDFDVSKYDAVYEAPDVDNDSIAAVTEELIARNALAKVIASNSSLGGSLNKWKQVLYDVESTAAQLDNARIELQRSLDFTNALTTISSNEYPMLFVRTAPYWKVLSNNSQCATILYHVWDSSSWSQITTDSGSGYVANYRYDNYYDCPLTQWDLPVIVEVDEEALFSFTIYCSGNYNSPMVTVIIDGEEMRRVEYTEANLSKRYNYLLTPGVHTITLRCQRGYGNSNYTYFRLYDFGCRKVDEEISVNLLEPGSLGTEVLYNVDNIRQVKRLKVKGPMNDDDWNRIYMMTDLTSLDLEEAEISTIKASQVSVDAHSSLSNLARFVMPRTVKTIGEKAFFKTNIGVQNFPEGLTSIGNNAFQYTDVTQAVLPSTVRSIGSYAFSHCSALTEVSIPDSAAVGSYAFNTCGRLQRVQFADNATVGSYAFYQCNQLEQAVLPANLTDVSSYLFCYCTNLDTVTIGNKVQSVADYAFAGCTNMNATLPETLTTVGASAFNSCSSMRSPLPAAVTSIGEYAFRLVTFDALHLAQGTTVGNYAFNGASFAVLEIGQNASIGTQAFANNTQLDSVVIGENSSLGSNAFVGCTNLRYIEFPSSYYQCNTQLLSSISGGQLEKVVFKSPTMVNGSAYAQFFNGVETSALTISVPAYLRNTYRLDSYWYNWPIEGFETQNVDSWYINNPLTLNARDRFGGMPSIEQRGNATYLKINGDSAQQFNNFLTYNQLMQLSTSDNITINGQLSIGYYTNALRWYFLCMPFDFRVGDLHNDNNAEFALRIYDGAKRATGATGANWIDCTADDIIPAGQGFIYQTNKAATTFFVAQDNDSKQNIFLNRIFVKSLDANDSENNAHKGWNLVGNPWRTYYNNHKLNFTGPITTWTGSTYKAYSLIDDDYALKCGEAFFVQCPDEVNSISFPVDGRQLTADIESQNAARATEAPNRWIVNLSLTCDSLSDQTRVVVNNMASADYETACDAGKFWSMDAQTPQLASLGSDEHTVYAINERPLDNGAVKLCVSLPTAATYVLRADRNDLGQGLMLIDHDLNVQTDLSQADYTFYGAQGYDTSRFELLLTAGAVTNVHAVATREQQPEEVYTLGGVRLKKLPAAKGAYVVRQGTQTRKIMVK